MERLGGRRKDSIVFNQNNDSDATSVPPGINRDRLNEIVRIASHTGARLGLEVQLTDEDRSDITKLTNFIEDRITRAITSDPNWLEFVRVENELNAKGVIGSGVFPPRWLIDGGQTSQVDVAYVPGHRTTITVPERVYNAYYWLKQCERLRRHTSMKDGQNAADFAKELKDVAHFLSQLPRS